MSTLILEGKFANHDREFDGRVEVNRETGLIGRVGRAQGSSDIDTAGCLIFPGFGDIHVHAREDAGGTQSYKETFRTASEAAVHGGVTFFAEMPNNPVAPVTDERYWEKEKLTKQSLVPVVLYGGIGPKTKPLSFPVPYKVFMGPSVGDLFFTSQEELESVIKSYRGQNVSFHCEDPVTLKAHEHEPTHELRRPPETETIAVDFALTLIHKYDLKGKICHASTLSAVRKIIEAKKRGVPVTIEIAPHHLYFDAASVSDEKRRWLQVNPALRTNPAERKELIALLRTGDIDYLATDHAPHTREEKLKGTSGMPHLDTYGPFATWLMREHKFTPSEVARVSAFNPGNFVNPYLPPKYGKGFCVIEEGYYGSFTIINLNCPTIVRADELKTKCGWSPFEGVRFPGSVTHTIVGGKVYNNS